MRTNFLQRTLLFISSIIAMGIGASILFIPEQFHAGYGIVLGGDVNLLSEVRAPGGTLLVCGALMMAGVVARSFTTTSLVIAAAVYLGYGFSRAVATGLDGMPAQGIVTAMAIELVIGLLAALSLARSTPALASQRNREKKRFCRRAANDGRPTRCARSAA